MSEITNKILSMVEYGDENVIRIYGTSDEPYFNGKDVCKCLGYLDTDKAIRKHVDIEDKIQYENEIIQIGGSNKTKHNSILINESGLYSLILRSKKQESKKFKRWITSDVLPSLRKKGSYVMPSVIPHPNVVDVKTELFLKNIETAQRLLKSFNTFDKRTELLFSDLVQNSVIGIDKRIEYKEDNENWSISRRLTEVYSITSKEAHKRIVNFGKEVVSKYRDKYGEEPTKHLAFVNGQTRHINSYFTNHYVEFIDDMIEEYFKDYLVYEDD